MAITAQSIIKRATDILQDNTSVRWPAQELVRWLNDAQREVVMYRPDAINVTTTMALISGTRQDLDTAGLLQSPIKLIEISRNTAVASTLQAIRLVPRKSLDDQTPGWHKITGSLTVLHYTFDARDPKTFYVYPPALVGAEIEVMYSAYPSDILEPNEGAFYDSVLGSISLPDIYAGAVLDYILYRAYSKDAEYAGNPGRAQSHYGAFTASLGVEGNATVGVQPQLKPGMAGSTK